MHCLLAGCASTTLQSAWFDSSFNGPAFKRVLVVGVTGNFTDRRVFDDIFAKMLTDAGVQGIPGYQFVDDAPSTNDSAFNAGVTRSGADAVLLVRLLGVDTRTQVTTTMVPAMGGSPFAGPFGGPFRTGPYGVAWGPVWYAVPAGATVSARQRRGDAVRGGVAPTGLVGDHADLQSHLGDAGDPGLCPSWSSASSRRAACSPAPK